MSRHPHVFPRNSLTPVKINIKQKNIGGKKIKKNNKKGFTLAELLIVVAIIAVLVAIAIPVFTNSLNRAKFMTDVANVRAAYAEEVTKAMDTYSGGSLEITKANIEAAAANGTTFSYAAGDKIKLTPSTAYTGLTAIDISVDDDVSFK